MVKCATPLAVNGHAILSELLRFIFNWNPCGTITEFKKKKNNKNEKDKFQQIKFKQNHETKSKLMRTNRNEMIGNGDDKYLAFV